MILVPLQQGRLALCLQRQAEGTGPLALLNIWITTALDLGASVLDPPPGCWTLRTTACCCWCSSEGRGSRSVGCRWPDAAPAQSAYQGLLGNGQEIAGLQLQLQALLLGPEHLQQVVDQAQAALLAAADGLHHERLVSTTTRW